MIKIYGVRQSRAMRALWVAEELGLQYEHIPTSFSDGDTQKKDYLTLNPNGRVPALVDEDGTVIWESQAINIYLAMKYDGGLWPASLPDQGNVVQWSFWVMTEIETLLLDVLLHRRALPEDQRDPELVLTSLEELKAPFSVINKHLEDREFVVGNSFSVADINVASVFSWALVSKVDLGPYPSLERWLKNITSRPKFKLAATGKR